MTQPVLAIQKPSAAMHKLPACVKCGILPGHALMAAVEGKGETVSPETEKAQS